MVTVEYMKAAAAGEEICRLYDIPSLSSAVKMYSVRKEQSCLCRSSLAS